MTLLLRNPHSVLAALETRPLDVLEVCPPGQLSGAWADVVERASRVGVAVVKGGRPPGGRRRKADEGGRQGGGFARVRERRPRPLAEVLRLAQSTSPGVPAAQSLADFPAPAAPGGPAETGGAGAGLWLALDCLQDPHNLGAIFRTAAFFGVRGVFVTRDRSAPVNETVYDVASGGVEYVPFAVETNLARTLRAAKEAGLWVLGTSEHADTDIRQVEPDRPWLVVLGNEERGLRRLTLELCDVVCRVTPRGPLSSLNVSVAAGVVLALLSR